MSFPAAPTHPQPPGHLGTHHVGQKSIIFAHCQTFIHILASQAARLPQWIYEVEFSTWICTRWNVGMHFTHGLVASMAAFLLPLL